MRTHYSQRENDIALSTKVNCSCPFVLITVFYNALYNISDILKMYT